MIRSLTHALAAIFALTSCAPPGRLDAETAGRSHDSAGHADTVRITADSSHAFVVMDAANRLGYLITLEATEGSGAGNPPLNVSLVIDKSGSMGAEGKMSYAKDAAEGVIDRLDAGDVISAVAYDDTVQTLVSARPYREPAKLRRLVRRLTPGGATNLYAGMTAGYEEVRTHYDESRLNRVILLSDGLANTGIADPYAIARRAERMRRHGVRVTTIGLGLEYDEELMSTIAERSGGNYYYVRRSDALPEILAAELDEMNHTVARDVTVTVELGHGVSLERIHGYPYEADGNEVRIDVSDLYGGERRKILLELASAPPSRAGLDVASSRVQYHDVVRETPGGASTATLSAATTTDLALVERTRNKAVLEKLVLVENALAQREAVARLKEGRRDEARALVSERVRSSAALNERELSSVELDRQLKAMERFIEGMESTEGDPRARRDLVISEQLRALGYIK